MLGKRSQQPSPFSVWGVELNPIAARKLLRPPGGSWPGSVSGRECLRFSTARDRPTVPPSQLALLLLLRVHECMIGGPCTCIPALRCAPPTGARIHRERALSPLRRHARKGRRRAS